MLFYFPVIKIFIFFYPFEFKRPQFRAVPEKQNAVQLLKKQNGKALDLAYEIVKNRPSDESSSVPVFP